MKIKRFFTILLLLVLLGGTLYYWYFYVYTPGKMEFTLISKIPIKMKKDDNIHFFSSGFAVSGDKTDFYTFEGVKTSNPVKQIPEPFAITLSTENYAVVQDTILLNTSQTPFKQVAEITNGKAWHMKEYHNLLLLLTQSEDGKIVPYALNQESSQLTKLEDPNQTDYFDSDADRSSGDFSVMTVEYQGSFPAARVFHYTNDLLPYGALSLEDEVFYQLYRLHKTFILVGTHQILCYNIDGTEKWSIKVPVADHQAVFLGSRLLLYMNDISLDNNANNSLLIEPDGSYQAITIQRGITQFQPYKDGALGLEDNNIIIFIDKAGELVKKTRINNADIQSIHTTKQNYDYLYLRTVNNQLFIFSTRPRKDDSR